MQFARELCLRTAQLRTCVKMGRSWGSCWLAVAILCVTDGSFPLNAASYIPPLLRYIRCDSCVEC